MIHSFNLSANETWALVDFIRSHSNELAAGEKLTLEFTDLGINEAGEYDCLFTVQCGGTVVDLTDNKSSEQK